MAAFRDHYYRVIAPQLPALEDRRKTAERNGKLIFAPFVFVGIIVTTALFMSDVEDFRIPLVAGGAIIALGFYVAFWELLKQKRKFKKMLIDSICRNFGLSYVAHPPGKLFERFERLGLLPSYDGFTQEDRFSGQFKNVKWDLVELTLIKSRRRRTDTVFKGLLIATSFHKPFKGRTIVVKDRLFGKPSKADDFGAERVKLEDPVFEDKFDVFSTDQVEARYLLTPAFMERIRAIGTGSDSTVSVAFDKNNLLIALPSWKNHFEGRSAFHDFIDRVHIETMLSDLAIVYDLIEILKLRTSTRV